MNGSVQKEYLYERLNRGMTGERARALESNLRKNLPMIRERGGVKKIVERLAGRHVILVGAGPSLEDALPSLATVRERIDFIILAVDMAWVPLVTRGIVPDFVISCETTPVPFFKAGRTEESRLLAFSCMSHSTLRQWRGDVLFYNWMLDDPFFRNLRDKAGEYLGSVATGGTVTTQGAALALGCPIRSLTLAGNDLGFSDRYYVRGSVPLERAVNGGNRFRTVESWDRSLVRMHSHYRVERGERVFHTDHSFLAAKTWMEDLFRTVSVPVYDISLPGCSEAAVLRREPERHIRELSGVRRRRRR